MSDRNPEAHRPMYPVVFDNMDGRTREWESFCCDQHEYLVGPRAVERATPRDTGLFCFPAPTATVYLSFLNI